MIEPEDLAVQLGYRHSHEGYNPHADCPRCARLRREWELELIGYNDWYFERLDVTLKNHGLEREERTT